jgi:hypothetical protein
MFSMGTDIMLSEPTPVYTVYSWHVYNFPRELYISTIKGKPAFIKYVNKKVNF